MCGIFDGGADKGATVPEYALVLVLLALALIPAIDRLQDQVADYLVDSSTTIGAERSGPPTPVTEPAPTNPVWVDNTPSLGPNLIVNGDFETPDLTGNAHTQAPPWNSTCCGNQAELWPDGFFGIPAYSGDQYAELNVDGITTYSQTVTVEVGKAYTWSLRHRGRNGTDTMQIIIDGTVVSTPSSPTGSWSLVTGTTVATTSPMTFALRSVSDESPGGLGNLLDDIRLQVIQ